MINLYPKYSEYGQKNHKQRPNFSVPRDVQSSETDVKPIFAIFSFWDMVDFVLKILRELRILTTVSPTLYEPDSEPLTSDTR